MIIKLLRYIEGYVGFLIVGIFPEKFINFCSKSGIYIWGLNPTPRGYEGYTTVSNYKKISKISRQTKTRTRIISRNGLPFTLTKYNKRWGIRIGLVACSVMLYAFSLMIWTININGTHEIDSESLKYQLGELGLKPGSFRKNIDAPILEMKIMMVEKRLAWIAINVQGSRVTVEVRERVNPPEEIDISGYATNVIASATGQIKRMEIYEGQPMVKSGDTVVKGDIIVSGITIDKFANTQVKQARALVIAWVPTSLDVSVPLVSQRVSTAGDVVRYKRIVINGYKIPISGAVNHYIDYTLSHTNKDIFGISWLSYQTTTLTPIKTEVFTISEFEAKEIAMDRLRIREETILTDCPIIQKSLYAKLEGQNFVLKCDYVIEKNIAMAVEILLN